MSQASSNLNPGDTLGAYQLLLPIGQGGMGQVWVAREKEAGPFPRYVAIKTALAHSSPNRQFWTALLDEAHIASSLRHPNVCIIHAVETQDSVVYLVMDWSDAGSLRDPLSALLIIFGLILAVAGFMLASWRQDRTAALLFLPYLAWVAFAAALNGAIVALN